MQVRDVRRLKRGMSRNADGGLSSHIDLYAFLDPRMILSYNGTLLVGFELDGVDYEGMTAPEMLGVTDNFAKFIQSTDAKGCVVYQWAHRRPVRIDVAQQGHPIYMEIAKHRESFFADGRAFLESRLYVAIEFPFQAVQKDETLRDRVPRLVMEWMEVLRGGDLVNEVKNRLRDKRQQKERVLETDVKDLRAYVRDVVEPTITEFQTAMSKVPLEARIMGYQKFYEAMLPIVNASPEKWHVKCVNPGPLDYALQLSSYDMSSGRCIQIDDRFADIFTLMTTGEQLSPRVLGKLDELPFEVLVSTSWCRISDERAEAMITRQRRGFKHQIRFGNPNRDTSQDIKTGYRDQVVDHLDHALTELKNDGAWFGRFSLTVMVCADTEEELVRRKAEIRSIFYNADLVPFDEDANLFFAWVAMVPGGFHRYNNRKLIFPVRNYAAFAPIWRLENGNPRSEHYGGPALSLLETRSGNPYHFNLSHKDNLNFLVLGKIGSGKSFFAKYHILEYLKYGKCFFWVHTLGADYHDLARLCGGQVVELDADGTFPLNLYVLEEELSSGYLNALIEVWRALFAVIGHEMTEKEQNELAKKLPILFKQPLAARNNRALWELVSKTTKPLIEPFIHDDQVSDVRYGRLFDGDPSKPETFRKLDAFTVIDYRGLIKEKPELAQACMIFISFMQDKVIYANETKSVFKFVWFDEGHKIVGSPDSAMGRYIKRAGDTWRKENTSLGFLTQSLDHLVELKLVTLFRECCSQFLFFPNPGINAKAYTEHFDFLTEREIELVQTMEAKREVLLKTTYGVSKVLRLQVDDFTRLVIESNPNIVGRKQELFDELGFPANIHALMREERAKRLAVREEKAQFGVL